MASVTEILGFQDEQFKKNFRATKILLHWNWLVRSEPLWYQEVNADVYDVQSSWSS